MGKCVVPSLKTSVRFHLPEKQPLLLLGKSAPLFTLPPVLQMAILLPSGMLRNAHVPWPSISMTQFPSHPQSVLPLCPLPTTRKGARNLTPSLFISNPQFFPESQKMTYPTPPGLPWKHSLKSELAPGLQRSPRSELRRKLVVVVSYLWVSSAASVLPPQL